jgi:hypothetical protein
MKIKEKNIYSIQLLGFILLLCLINPNYIVLIINKCFSQLYRYTVKSTSILERTIKYENVPLVKNLSEITN